MKIITISRQYFGKCIAVKALRELSLLKLGTGLEEFLEGYQSFVPRFIGVSNISNKIVKYVMGCEIFEIFRLQ